MFVFPAAPESNVDALLALPVESPTFSSRPSPLISLGRFTKTEIMRLLREAYALIMEKDRELTFAAKLRHQVMEENDILQEKYSELLEYVSQFNLFNEGVIGNQLNNEYELSPSPPPPAQLRLRSTPRRSNDYYDQEEVIATLEQLNQELQQKVDHALQEKESMQKKGERKIRQLEYEVEQLRLELDHTCQTIQSLEKLRREDQPSRPPSQEADKSVAPQHRFQREQQTEDEVVDILIAKIASLEKLNDTIIAQKSTLETRLETVMGELEEIAIQASNMEDSVRDYTELLDAYEKQSLHVAELSQSVEDQRSWIQNLFGQFSPRSAPRVFSPSASPAGSVLRSPNRSSFLGRSGYTPSPGLRKKRTLLHELESEWVTQTTSTPRISNTVMTPRTIAHSGYLDSPPITPLGIFQSPTTPIPLNNEYLRDVLNHGGGESEESASEEESVEKKRIRNGLFGWIRRLMKSLIKSVLKWCRFLFFLSMAVVIAIYRGPDGATL